MSNENNKNTRDFPIHKMNLEVDPSQPEKAIRQLSAGEKRKISVSGALLSLVFIGSIVWQSDPSGGTKSVPRGIASPGEPVVINVSEGLKSRILEDLANDNGSSNAVRGAQPSLLDAMLFGELRGQFFATVNDGKIAKVYQRKNSGKEIGSPPVFLSGSPQAFLKRYAQLLPFEFDRVRADLQGSEGGDLTFKLFQGGQHRGTVLFKFGVDGNFLEFAVL